MWNKLIQSVSSPKVFKALRIAFALFLLASLGIAAYTGYVWYGMRMRVAEAQTDAEIALIQEKAEADAEAYRAQVMMEVETQQMAADYVANPIHQSNGLVQGSTVPLFAFFALALAGITVIGRSKFKKWQESRSMA